MKNKPGKLNNFISFSIFCLLGFAAWGAIFWVSTDRPNLEEAVAKVEKYVTAAPDRRIVLRTNEEHPQEITLQTDYLEPHHLQAINDFIIEMQAKEKGELHAGGFKVRTNEEIINQFSKEG